MLKILALIFPALVQILATFEDPYRVIGAFPAEQGQFPFSASLQYSGRFGHFCGAGIISKRWLLTASHCIRWMDVTDFVVYVGSIWLDEFGVYYNVEKKVLYPRELNFDKFANDIALVKVAEDITFNELIKPLLLPINISVKPGEEATTIGWGDTSYPGGYTSNRLMFLTRQIIDSAYCALVLIYNILESQLCFGGDLGHGTCHGDSGSPLIYDVNNESYVIGVVSFGYPCAAGYPDVYSNVSFYLPWILREISPVDDL